MRSYPFIKSLFTNVLQLSHGIEGRFTMSTKNALEINTDNMDQVLPDLAQPDTSRKYPLAIMPAPSSNGDYVYSGWEEYQFIIFFLKTTYYTGGNQIASPNANTQTSTHTIPEDWHDMKRCAINFLRFLEAVIKANTLQAGTFRLQHGKQFIKPVSSVGVDRASGVMLSFKADVAIGCNIEDYDTEDLNSINIPVEDSHPEHSPL